jgi:hypothetical protein
MELIVNGIDSAECNKVHPSTFLTLSYVGLSYIVEVQKIQPFLILSEYPSVIYKSL